MRCGRSRFQSATGNNDNWSQASNSSSIQQAASAVGAFALPWGSADAAMLPSIAQGQYTAVISGVNGGTGNALVEVYDTDTNNPLRLINISTRAKVLNGSAMTAGFVVTGNTGKKLLIRAIGPTLSSFGISGALSNPRITLYSGSSVIYTNDDWGQNWNAGSIPSVSSQVGAFGLSSGSADSVLLVDLPPGAYTAIVDGVGGTEGIALVEVYEVN